MSSNTTVLHVSQHHSFAGVTYRYLSMQGKEICGSLAADFSSLNIFLDEFESDFIASAATLVVAGLFVPDQIKIEWSSNASQGEAFQRLLSILYDVRAYCSQTDFRRAEIISKGTINHFPMGSTPLLLNLDEHIDHLQLFSGGIDSTCSLLKLKNAGASPVALYCGLNADTAQLEQEAARRIAAHLNVTLVECSFVQEGFPARGADPDIWPQFGQFPYYNSIPHGRDILSAAVAGVIASRCGIKKIAFGQERESREKVVRYKGRNILRHDIESHKGAAILNKWLNQNLEATVELISPVEDMSIKEIRLHMAARHPDELSMTQSCVWERLCCRCLKCISLYILQRITGKQLFDFKENPLADPSNEDLSDLVNTDVPDNEVGYGEQIRNGIRQILAESKYGEDDYWIIRASKNMRFVS